MRNLEESLFWEIFYRRQATRSALEHEFNVIAATISRSADLLLSKRLIIETGTTVSFRGRPPALLQINPELAEVGGLELDRDRITAVVTDMTGNLQGRGAVEVSPSNPVARTLRDCQQALRMALSDAGVSRARLSRMGVGYTGRLDVQSGVRLHWEGTRPYNPAVSRCCPHKHPANDIHSFQLASKDQAKLAFPGGGA